MNTRLLAAGALAAVIAFAPASAQRPTASDTARLHAVLDSIRQAVGARGASAALIFADGRTWTGVSGDAWAGQPVTAQTLFDVGSITKSYTAALTLQLVRAGVLRLDDSVQRWLPNAAFAPGVTLRHLLQHTSGIADYTSHAQFMAAIQSRMGAPWPPEENLRFVGPATAAPGAAWRYSNTNYVLLGLIAAKAGGQSYATLLRTRVLDALGLHGTFVAGEDSIPPLRAHAFLDFNNDGTPDDLSALVPDPAITRGAGGAGAIVATALDAARFARAYYTGALTGPELYREATQWRDRGDGWQYGFGIIANPAGDELRLGHLGNTAGQSAGVWHASRSGVTAVLLTNAHAVPIAEPAAAMLRAALSMMR